MDAEDMEKILIDENLKIDKKDFQRGLYLNYSETNFPKYPLLLITCMDPRIDVHDIFNLKPGDIFILRNAGNLITKDMLRSIYIAINEFKINFIIILGHLDCGMTKLKLHELRSNLDLNLTQYELRDYFKPFADELISINTQVQKLRQNKLISSKTEIKGMLYDVNTGYVYEQNVIEKFKSIEEFNKNYYRLIKEKQSRSIEHEFKEIGYNETNEEKMSNIIEEKENQLLSKNSRKKSLVEESREVQEENQFDGNFDLMSKLNLLTMKMPKIYIPKIKIHVPQIYKKKDKK